MFIFVNVFYAVIADAKINNTILFDDPSIAPTTSICIWYSTNPTDKSKVIAESRMQNVSTNQHHNSQLENSPFDNDINTCNELKWFLYKQPPHEVQFNDAIQN